MMINIGIDKFSSSACPVTLFSQGSILANATGFFWKKEKRIYLVSNWHVFSGREPSTGQPKDRQYCRVPDEIHVKGVYKDNPNAVFSLKFSLYDDKEQALWIQHKEFGQKVDVAMLLIGRMSALNVVLKSIPCLNEMPSVSDIVSQIGQDVFVLGFPLNIMKTGVFPIWKRASIATEPEFPVNDMPCLLIDTATREGMSGAPVIQRANSFKRSDGSRVIAGPTVTQFIGIYSGRFVGELGEAQLGIV